MNKNFPSYSLADLTNRLSKLIELETTSISLQNKILSEFLDRRDEGKAIYANGTLSATRFTVIDLVNGTEQLNR